MKSTKKFIFSILIVVLLLSTLECVRKGLRSKTKAKTGHEIIEKETPKRKSHYNKRDGQIPLFDLLKIFHSKDDTIDNKCDDGEALVKSQLVDNGTKTETMTEVWSEFKCMKLKKHMQNKKNNPDAKAKNTFKSDVKCGNLRWDIAFNNIKKDEEEILENNYFLDQKI